MNIKILKGLFEKGLDVEEVTSEDPLAPFHHMEHFVHCSCWRLVVPDEKTPFSHFVKKPFLVIPNQFVCHSWGSPQSQNLCYQKYPLNPVFFLTAFLSCCVFCLKS